MAYPTLLPRPSVPFIIDPDRWVSLLDGHCYSRKVQHDTRVSVDGYPYYLTADLVGQVVVLRIAAATREFAVEHHGQEYKRMMRCTLVGGGPAGSRHRLACPPSAWTIARTDDRPVLA
jgi:hypothetical protein